MTKNTKAVAGNEKKKKFIITFDITAFNIYIFFNFTFNKFPVGDCSNFLCIFYYICVRNEY